MKDGQGLKTDKQFQRSNSANRKEQSNSRASEAPSKATASSNVEIPDNVDSMTVKQLKVLLDSLNMKRDDCFEKDDLV